MTLPTDLEIAGLCNAIYAPAGTAWEHFDDGADSDGVCWALKRTADAWVLVFRGSVTLLDWLRDGWALADPFHHDDIGPVSPGFLSGMRTVQREMLPIIGADPVIVAGHSLGAARASILAGLLTVAGRPPIGRVVFGEPKPGFARLGEILEVVPGRSYRNGGDRRHDLVTDLPFSMPPEDYVHPTALIPVLAEPDGGILSRLGMFSMHHMPLYVQAMTSLATTK